MTQRRAGEILRSKWGRGADLRMTMLVASPENFFAGLQEKLQFEFLF
jgi:hypothetical protein